MCGIAGAVSGVPSPKIGPLCLELTRALQHRGPDGEGFWRSGPDGAGLCARPEDELARDSNVVLGHRRLSIVDLEGGAQPMPNEDGDVWLIFNGEIYNHLELRQQLERAGHRFRTRADTEVIVHGWEEWEEGLFGRLNGIFAFALVDRRSQEVVLARDPVGVKPLYYGGSPGLTWWASELAAAAAAGAVGADISPAGMKLFFTFRFIPSPYTIFGNSWKLPPGHFLRFGIATQLPLPHPQAYKQTVRSSAEPRLKSEWREALGAELEAAVERQLMADVPVGALLSGGVDSSLVTLLMKRHLEQAPQTFAIGFRSDGSANEALAAREAADALIVPLRSTVVSDDEYLAAWPEAVRAVGEPIGNAGGLLVDLVCRDVGRTHKVVLSGQGADEPLGGYPRHLVERLAPLARPHPSLTTRLARPLLGAESTERLRRALAARDRLDRYIQIFSVLPHEQVDALVTAGPPARELARMVVARWMMPEPPADALNELLRIDSRMSLADDLLLIADHFSMRRSVELRVPFLDLAFLDLVERMPSRYKISRLGERKWLYREMASARLPRQLRRRLCGPRARFGRKRGFSVPIGSLLSSESRTGIGDGWLTQLAEVPFLSPSTAADFGARSSDGNHARWSVTLYSLAMWASGNQERTSNSLQT